MKRFLLIFFFITPTFAYCQEQEQKFSFYFENDKHTLTQAHAKIIDSIQLAKHKDSLDIHIKGYTNSVGDSLYNLILSRKRAQSVKERLRNFTIISTQGFGELASEDPKNRRVDILVHYKKDHVPEKGEVVEPPQKDAIKAVAIHVEEKPIERLQLTLKPPYNKGDKITLQGIFFYKNMDVIKEESREALDTLVAFLKTNKNIKFKLIGHICCGDPEMPSRDLRNVRTGKDDLSEARAKSLYNYLVKKGIRKKRMRYIGKAFTQPTGKSDVFDRRVEIEITSVD